MSARAPGALVISLDFELHWGVRDHTAADGPYRANLLGVWAAVPRLLALFEEFGVAATWATVGFLFARTREEMVRFSPAVKPAYRDRALDPFTEPVGEGEEEDRLHFAPSLIRAIRGTPRQELATHTYSHYYCREPGQDRDAFRADLESAVRIAEHNGVALRSIVFPRNQYNPAYEDLLMQAGIRCFRGNQRAPMYRANSAAARVARLADSYTDVGGAHTVPWHQVPHRNGLSDVRASFFVRPYAPRLRGLEPLRLRRITRSLAAAARGGEILHLWWHPHNFGVNLEANLAFLREILVAFDRHRQSEGMLSLTMIGAAEMADGIH